MSYTFGVCRTIGIRVSVLMTALSCLGCGLTNSQLAAVQMFSKEAKSFAAAPAGVVTAYDDVYVTREAFETSTLGHVGGPGGIWRMTNGAVDTQIKIAAQAKQLTDALQIISRYADLLTTLSSSDFTDADDKSAEALGKSVNSAVGAFNSAYKTKVSSIGGWVAGGVELVGDLYIRERQSEELRYYVAKGDPMLADLSMALDSGLDDLKTNITSEETAIGFALCSYEGRSVALADARNVELARALRGPGRRLNFPSTPEAIEVPSEPERCPRYDGGLLLAPETSEMIIQARIKIRAADQLADSVKQASLHLREAHKALDQALEQPASLADAIAQIQQLRQEVQKANELRHSLNK